MRVQGQVQVKAFPTFPACPIALLLMSLPPAHLSAINFLILFLMSLLLPLLLMYLLHCTVVLSVEQMSTDKAGCPDCVYNYQKEGLQLVQVVKLELQILQIALLMSLTLIQPGHLVIVLSAYLEPCRLNIYPIPGVFDKQNNITHLR